MRGRDALTVTVAAGTLFAVMFALYPFRLFPTILMRKNNGGYGYPSLGAHTKLHREMVKQVFLVREQSVYRYFEDWVDPFITSLSIFVPVQMMSFSSAINTTFTKGDVVLVVQRTRGLRVQSEGEYWFMNTEGTDKRLAEDAIDNGFYNIIDFTLKGVERLSRYGAEQVLWLPIIQAPGLPAYLPRTDICMIGPANTPRRVKLVNALRAHISNLEERVDFKHVEGWSDIRAFQSQQCSLVVHVSSTDVNLLAARLRLDILWLYDVPVISESAFEPDVSEYQGTMKFVNLSSIVEETINTWRIIVRSKNKTKDAFSHYKRRLTVLKSRQERFRETIGAVLHVNQEQ